MKSKKILAAVMAAMMTLLNIASALPALAVGADGTRYAIPAGYNTHDYDKCVAFLEQEGVFGQKNGFILDENYDPSDPETWGHYWKTLDDGFTYLLPCFAWVTVAGEKRLDNVYIVSGEMRCSLDLSGCTALTAVFWQCGSNGFTEMNFNGCSALRDVRGEGGVLADVHLSGCSSLVSFVGNVTEIDLHDCAALKYLDIQSSGCTALDLSANTELLDLNCEYTQITSLDISHNTKLRFLWCRNNSIRSFDLSHNPKLAMQHVYSQGGGYVGYTYQNYEDWNGGCLFAYPVSGESFIGWYDTNGDLVSTESWYGIEFDAPDVLTARFTGAAPALPGDVDGDGYVNANDALRVLRVSLGLETGLGLEADVTGDGFLNANDALLILRAALGLSSL